MYEEKWPLVFLFVCLFWSFPYGYSFEKTSLLSTSCLCCLIKYQFFVNLWVYLHLYVQYFFVLDKVSLCSSGWPETRCVDQAGPKLKKYPPVSAF